MVYLNALIRRGKLVAVTESHSCVMLVFMLLLLHYIYLSVIIQYITLYLVAAAVVFVCFSSCEKIENDCRRTTFVIPPKKNIIIIKTAAGYQ